MKYFYLGLSVVSFICTQCMVILYAQTYGMNFSSLFIEPWQNISSAFFMVDLL